jgi:ADP-ribose pyrophosphatase
MKPFHLSSKETLQKPIKVGAPKEVYRDPYTIISRQVVQFEGFQKRYYMWNRGIRVGLIPFHQGRVLMTRQYRFLANRITLEIPGGKAEKGEKLKEAAIRECKEETGFECRKVKKLIYYHPGLDTYYNPTTIFISSELKHPKRNNGKSCRWINLSEALRGIFNGKINDSFSIIGLLALSHRVSKK